MHFKSWSSIGLLALANLFTIEARAITYAIQPTVAWQVLDNTNCGLIWRNLDPVTTTGKAVTGKSGSLGRYSLNSRTCISKNGNATAQTTFDQYTLTFFFKDHKDNDSELRNRKAGDLLVEWNDSNNNGGTAWAIEGVGVRPGQGVVMEDGNWIYKTKVEI